MRQQTHTWISNPVRLLADSPSKKPPANASRDTLPASKQMSEANPLSEANVGGWLPTRAVGREGPTDPPKRLVRRRGIEPLSRGWQPWIFPLDHRRRPCSRVANVVALRTGIEPVSTHRQWVCIPDAQRSKYLEQRSHAALRTGIEPVSLGRQPSRIPDAQRSMFGDAYGDRTRDLLIENQTSLPTRPTRHGRIAT